MFLKLLPYTFSILLFMVHGCPRLAKTNSDRLDNKKINYRLPRHICPISYNITLEPELNSDLYPVPFEGSVIIKLKITEDANNITLHTRKLTVDNTTITLIREDGKKVQVLEILGDEARDFYIIKLQSLLLSGETYTLTIGHYNGALYTDKGGFYLAKYYDQKGIERRFATTQFQSINARKAFPSFDEPHLKATLAVSLIRNEKFVTVSNEELIESKKLENGRIQDIYKETVPMSTYLAAFVVSEHYQHTNLTDRHRIFADKDDIAEGQADYALQIGIETLNAIEAFLGVNYTLNKMDQIAIPDDYFDSGAMENWGLVTYKKSSLVYPYQGATITERQKTVQIIAHEFAHQWFGNLVTCSWWRFIWLNEGFANYFESYAASLVKPSWRLMDQFVLTSLQRALEADSSNATQPMNSETDYPGGGPPSWVGYQKAGSIIRMFEHFLTHDIFKKALKNYLKTNAFRSVEPPHLYEALQETLSSENAGFLLGNLTVSMILTTWDSQAGYPVVNALRNYTTGGVLLNQNRFTLPSLNKDDESLWYIPINFYSLSHKNNNTTADFWMTQKEHQITTNFSSASWIIINKKQTGFYRVNYDEINWRLLIDFLNNENIENIHVLNRAQLIDDSFNLARAGVLNYQIPLDLSKYLTKETDYVPVTSFLNSMKFLGKMLAFTSEYKTFQKFLNNSLVGTFQHLGFNENEDDEHVDKLNRINVLKWLCDIGNEECRSQALYKLRSWQENNMNLINPNLEDPIFCGAMRIGTQNDWDFLYAKHKMAQNTSQRIRLLNALGCSENVTILNRYLQEFLISDTSVRQADKIAALKSVYNSGRIGLNVAFKFLDQPFVNLSQIVESTTVLEDIAGKFTTEEQLKEMEAFGEKHNIKPSLIEKAVKKIEENIEWCKKYSKQILIWLENY